MILQRVSFIFLLTFYSFKYVDLLSQYPIILIVSYDAFRYDYLSRGFNPVLTKLRNSGTFAEYMDNVFVTKTFPNHHSIATGVYPEYHGVLGKSVYDSFYKRRLNYSYELFHYSNETVPIWIANEKKGGGRHSGVMMWPGNEYEYGGIRPTYQKSWDYKVPWTKRVDIIIDWFLNPYKPANLVLLYIEEPDYHGHAFGIDSPNFTDELKLMDDFTSYLLSKLNQNNLTNDVNIFFISDHGLISLTKKDVIDLRKYVSSELYDMYETSPGLHIYPKPGKANIVYSALKNAIAQGEKFTVYRTSEIPDHWHFKNNRRAPPILALADPPHAFHDFYFCMEQYERQLNFTAHEDSQFGMHGYDNKYMTMKPFFIAVGPAIKSKFKSEPFSTLDLFSLWAHMSGFPEYAAKTNGSLAIVGKMLKKTKEKNPKEDGSLSIGRVFLRILLIGFIINLAVYFVYRKWYFQRKRSYMKRFSQEPADSRQRLLDAEEET